MKILAVSQYFTPDITAAAFRIGETVEILRERGHNVKVITAYPHKSNVDPDDNEKNIYRAKIASLGNGGLLRYLLHYLSFIPGSIWKALKLKLKGWKPDVLWVSSPPLFIGISGWLIKKITGCPLVLDIRDIWPDTAVAAGQLSEDGKAYKLGRRLELFLYKKADYLTCVSNPMGEYLKSQDSTKDPTVVYNGVSAASINGNDVQQSSSSADCKTLMYAGNMGYLQGLDVLVKAFADLKNDNGLVDDWRIELIGGGTEEEDLKELTSKLGLEDSIKFVGMIPKEEVHPKLISADLLFFSLKSHPVLEKTIPSKLFDYLITGIPIIGGIEGEGKHILHKVESNLTFEAGNPNDLTEKLSKAFENIEERKEQSPQNIQLVKRNYTREKMAKKLMEKFSMITKNN